MKACFFADMLGISRAELLMAAVLEVRIMLLRLHCHSVVYSGQCGSQVGVQLCSPEGVGQAAE